MYNDNNIRYCKQASESNNSAKFTAYVSPYFQVSNDGAYTKHIYSGSQRIASKLGNENAFGADPRRVEQAGGLKITDLQTDLIEHRFAALGQKYEKPRAEETRLDSTADSEEREKLIFFYHPDQLNSTSFITDIDGNAVQFVSYIPYGEVFVEERNSSFSSSYLFNAKELDNETGLYYYGARYLDPQSIMWLSVDPLWEKYQGVSPYSYCVGNPVRLVDPDGRDWITAEYEGETFLYFDENIKSQKDVVDQYYGGEKRSNYSINYLGETAVYSSDNDGTFLLNPDGSYIHNGETKKSEYSNDGKLHIGSSFSLNTEQGGVSSNWYGNYLGPNNPREVKTNNYFYSIPPIDDLDYAAFLHDKSYDKKKAEGWQSAVFNWKVVGADWDLVRRCENASNDGSQNKMNWSKKTGSAFRYIGLFKEMFLGGRTKFEYPNK